MPTAVAAALGGFHSQTITEALICRSRTPVASTAPKRVPGGRLVQADGAEALKAV